MSTNIQQTHKEICIRCPEDVKGCFTNIHHTWNFKSVESHIIQKSSRRCFHWLSGEYTVAVFGQSVGGVLQKGPLIVSVVSISKPTTHMSSEICECNFTSTSFILSQHPKCWNAYFVHSSHTI